jgi:hypothetical protein
MFDAEHRRDRAYPPFWRYSDEPHETRDRVAILVVLAGGILAGLIVAWNVSAGFTGSNDRLDLARLLSSDQAARKLSGYQPSVSDAGVCAPDKPVFDARFGELQRRLGTLMGAAGECARQDAAGGDIVQHTSTGLAIIRAANGTAIFTNGLEHWALAAGSLVFWNGSGVDPPREAVPVADGLVRPETAPPSVPASSTAIVAGTDGAGVVLRASPRDDDRTPRGFMDGAHVTVLERSGAEWARVRGENGQEGWIPARYIR